MAAHAWGGGPSSTDKHARADGDSRSRGIPFPEPRMKPFYYTSLSSQTHTLVAGEYPLQLDLYQTIKSLLKLSLLEFGGGQ